MPEGSSAGHARTPKHLWIVGILALLWNGFGALNYTLTQTRNEAVMKSMTPQQIAYIESFPAWAVSGWALGVWGGVVASLLLLARKRAAAPVFLISLLGAVVSQAYTYVFSSGREIMGGGASALVLPVMIVAGAIFLYLYARNMAGLGALS